MRMRGPAGPLSRRLVLWGIVLTWAVGGVVALEGYRLISQTVRREAEARVEDAMRVARRLVDAEFDRMAPGDEGVVRVPPDEVAGGAPARGARPLGA